MKSKFNLLREFSVPLISGVILALIWANIDPDSYHKIIEQEIIFGVNLHFIINDIFMVFFFAMAAVEIVQSLVPGGDLYPLKKAVNPLMATLGGILGPVAVYLGLNSLIGSPELTQGWGIPTATDIALAWLVARFVFGKSHPAVKFLLLLAIVDDGIGLAIIAIFYPDPNYPVEPLWLLLVLAAMGLAYLMQKLLQRIGLRHYWPYLLVPGVLSWVGLHNAHLHPALSLVFIVPFLPYPRHEFLSLFETTTEEQSYSALAHFEHEWKALVDVGLFFFGLTNAGVQLSGIDTATWLVFAGLLAGKTIGIFLLGNLAILMGFSLPSGMGQKELFTAGLIAALGLTVALFVAGTAFVDPHISGAAKMGALLSGFIAILAIITGRLLGIKKVKERVPGV